MEAEYIADTESESESESEWDPKSSTESDSLSENVRKNKGRKRKKTRKQGVSNKCSRQIIEDQVELHVTCGNKKGILNVEKYNDMQECIFSEGRWFTPSGFEKFGGRERSKKWKNSIRCDGFPLQKLLEDVMQTDREGAKTVRKETINSELFNSLKDFPESWKRCFSKTVEIRVCRIEGEILPKETIQPDSSSDESISVAERVKLTRRESVIPTETVSKIISQQVESTENHEVSPSHPTDAPEPAVSPVIEEADRTSDDEEAAPPSFSPLSAELQNSVDSDENQESGQMQLFEFLVNQFKSINEMLKSIDTSLKKLLEKQGVPHTS